MTEAATRRDARTAPEPRVARAGPALDVIFVRDIRLETLIGAYEFERRQPRTLQVNVEIGRPSLRACSTDRLADTIDYSEVVGRVKEIFSAHRFHLLESLAELLAQDMLDRFDAHWICLEISKSGIVPNARDVGVRIERWR
jgi:dihydroneopterin aldolase